MRSYKFARVMTRWFTHSKGGKPSEFFIDKRKEFQDPSVDFSQFISNIRQMLFTRNVLDLPIDNFEANHDLLQTYIERGMKKINADITKDDIAQLISLYSLIAQLKQFGIRFKFLSGLDNLFENNFNKSLEKFIFFIKSIEQVIPLMDEEISKDFVPLKTNVWNVLLKERQTMSAIQQVQLISFLMNFTLLPTEQDTIKGYVDDFSKVE
jgi:hypothetical protein